MLEAILKDQSKEFCSTIKTIEVSNEEIEEKKKDAIVIIPAGGRGTRIKNVTFGRINKVMIKPKDKSLIEMCVESYANSGFKNFLVLIAHKGKEVMEHLGDGERFGVKVTYSREKGLLGRGGAILNAILNGSLRRDKTAIVHNPDDVIVGYDDFPDHILRNHALGLRKSCIATVVCASGKNYQFSGMLIRDGLVLDFAEYPFVPIPTHVGVSVLDPRVYPRFEERLEGDVIPPFSFESVIFPQLAAEKKLFSAIIPSENWFVVNDLKGLELLQKALEES